MWELTINSSPTLWSIEAAPTFKLPIRMRGATKREAIERGRWTFDAAPQTEGNYCLYLAYQAAAYELNFREVNALQESVSTPPSSASRCWYSWRYLRPQLRGPRQVFTDIFRPRAQPSIGRIRPLSTTVGRANTFLAYASGCPAHACPVAHYHVNDPTCRPGGSGGEPGAQNGPHYHVGSRSCHAGDPAPGTYPDPRYAAPEVRYCVRPHHHVGDPSWRPAPTANNGGY